jgi:4-hydroxy-tetrahydrodipicolinate reductase
MRIFISGASGNVGKTLVRTIQKLDGFELVGGWCKEAGQDLGKLAGIDPIGIAATDDIKAGLESARPDMVIDFSSTAVILANLEVYAKEKFNAVIGTTGLTDEQLEPFKKTVREKGLRWSVIPNYGIGACLINDFIKMASGYYPYVSIIDRHMPDMANAPSGTAESLAKSAKGACGPVASKEIYPGVLGVKINGVQVISQRLPYPGPYSEHEIILARQDELIKITLEDHTSDIYMEGVFLAAKKLPTLPAGTFIREMSEIL